MITNLKQVDEFFRNIQIMGDNPEIPLEPVSTDSPTPVDGDRKPINDSTVDITIDVSKDSPEITRPDYVEDQEYVSPETIETQMLKVYNRLDYIESLLKVQSGLGMEGLTDTLKKALFGIVNIIGHVVNLFTTGLFYGWRDFKRSELQEYCDSNVLTVSSLMNEKNFGVYRTLQVECPRGMQGMYRPAVTALLKYLNDLDMGARSKEICAMIERLVDDVHHNNLQVNTYVRQTHGSILPKKLEVDYITLGKKYFTSGSRDKDTFEKLFDSVSDVKDIVDDVKNADSHLREVATVHDRLMTINSAVNDMITNHVDKIKAAQINDLVNLIRDIAFSFDRYSVVVNDLTRVGHNLVIDIRRMRDAVNL